ncbi:hypothetical protein GRZ55_11535 [Chelativorans sp. ZYF759]|uniref:hypothetical protein n=1 Tax=Chelativorans sp. ZYF759 TaxID=2692213 RepID=UPI00145C7667|nr:hypothetical protein [Chelativorans sp. ZYF759]NMG39875.1 hypothetical protein [Chelativorans sp. ZYF759]
MTFDEIQLDATGVMIRWKKPDGGFHREVRGPNDPTDDLPVEVAGQIGSFWTPARKAAYNAAYYPEEPAPTPEEIVERFRTAIEAHVDEVARQRQYSGAVSISTYVSSTNPAWAAEAQGFIVWRDAVWVYAFTELAKVEAGDRAVPEVGDFLAELPAMEWPD